MLDTNLFLVAEGVRHWLDARSLSSVPTDLGWEWEWVLQVQMETDCFFKGRNIEKPGSKEEGHTDA